MDPKDKIVGSLQDLFIKSNLNKLSGKTIVLTHGCFDLIHSGHLEYLCDASERGFLIVGVNDDESVRRLKGNSRPIRNQNDRAFIIAGFEAVGLVYVFDNRNELIRAVAPNIYVVSSSSTTSIWDDKERIKLLKTFGTTIIELEQKRDDLHTTSIIEKILQDG